MPNKELEDQIKNLERIIYHYDDMIFKNYDNENIDDDEIENLQRKRDKAQEELNGLKKKQNFAAVEPKNEDKTEEEKNKILASIQKKHNKPTKIIEENKKKRPQEQEPQPEEQKNGNMNIAPILKWNADKWNNKGTYNKKAKEGYFFYQLPMPIIDYIFSTLDGKNGMLLKIMIVLIGTDEGFGVSEKWICDRIGLKGRDKARSYYKARDDLDNMRWIIYDKQARTITLNYDMLWDEAFQPESKRMPVLDFRKSPELFDKYVAD